jgi:transposase
MKTKTKTVANKKDLYAAVDLHGDNGFYCVINDKDQRVFEKRLPNDLKAVLEALEPFRQRLVHGIAVESTFNWYWLANALQDRDYSVQLVNTTEVPVYSGLKTSDDRSDAFHLAHLQRLGLLPTGYIYPREQRGARDLLRRRMLLVGQRTTHVLSFKSLMERQNGSSMTSSKIKTLTPESVVPLFKDAQSTLMGQANVRMIRALNEEIDHLEKAAKDLLKLQPDFQRLQQIPGVGEILNMVIMLETGPIERFASAGNYASYCRAVPSIRISNEHKKGENNRKCGNKYLAWAWLEAATFAIRYNAEIKAWHQRKLKRSGGKCAVAIKALSAKLAKAAWHMLKNKEPFKMEQLFG